MVRAGNGAATLFLARWAWLLGLPATDTGRPRDPALAAAIASCVIAEAVKPQPAGVVIDHILGERWS